LDTFQLHLFLEYLDRFFNVVSNLYANGHQNPFFILTILILAREQHGYLGKKLTEAKRNGLYKGYLSIRCRNNRITKKPSGS
jgi:hypothetical protein